MALDALKRRHRLEAQPSGKPIPPIRERDLFWFEKLHRHGDLPSPYLIEYQKTIGYTGDVRGLERLTQLYHDGKYLERPFQQHNDQLRYQPMTYALKPMAQRALEAAGRWRTYAPAHAIGMWWHHDFMLSCITASIELACLKEPQRYRYIFHDEICEKLGKHLSFKVRYKNANGEWLTQDLRPDRAFAIKDLTTGATRMYLLEADRGTETRRGKSGRKSLIDNDLQYRKFIGEFEYKEAMQTKGGIVLLNAFANPDRMRGFMEEIEPCNYMAFKALPVFGREFKVPPVMYDLFTEAWERPGKEPFYLNK